ncbi:MAG: hypothetical protein ACI8TX_002002 [Hyphomicrobiaceae bacterium]|jgi:hypothetical protein
MKRMIGEYRPAVGPSGQNRPRRGCVQPQIARVSRTLGLVLALIVTFPGCALVGPAAVRQDRIPYNEVISRSWNEQLLLNLVRLKYRDTPFFLELGSISTQYTLSASLGADVDLNPGQADDFSASSGVSYSERPTVSYAPLRGERFAKQLLSPIPVESLLLLMGSGWKPERVLATFVQQINDVPNAREASGPTPDIEPEFRRFRQLVELIGELHGTRRIELGFATEQDRKSLMLRFATGGDDHDQVARLRSMLGLDPAASGCTFSQESALSLRGDVIFVPRSFLGAMFYLSQSVEAPSAHRDAGLVTSTVREDGSLFDWSEITGDLMRIRSSDTRPGNAFIAIPYRGSWFWIADADLSSKSTFGLLAQLFNLQAGNLKLPVPVLTLPIGQ